MSSLGCLPFFDKLSSSNRVLLAGAGGGFDIFSGLPLYRYLRNQGKMVFLANLSFSPLSSPLQKVTSQMPGSPTNFPELYLTRWFAGQGEEVPIYCLAPAGARRLHRLYQQLAEQLDLDALVLIDGGTDSLMRGDEPGLGSPGEDVASLAAVSALDLPVRLLACLGFGLDSHHHVCHAYALEAASDLTAKGDFLGAFSLLPHMAEFADLPCAIDYVAQHMNGRTSIVASSVIAAAKGRFGHMPVRGGQAFVNPLTSMYWCFTVDGLARRCLYLDSIRETESRGEVTQAIQFFRQRIRARPWVTLPI